MRMMRTTKLKRNKLFVLLIMMIVTLTLANARADIPLGSPIQMNGEDWTIPINSEEDWTDPQMIIIDPESKDAFLLSTMRIDLSINWTIMRITSEGVLVWSTVLGKTSEISYNGLCLSPDGTFLYTLTEGVTGGVLNAPVPEIYLAMFEAGNGIYKDMFPLDNPGKRLQTSSNSDMLFHPDDPDRLWIHYPFFDPLVYDRSTQIIELEMTEKTVTWEYTYPSAVKDAHPKGMRYSQSSGFLYCITDYLDSGASYDRGLIWKIGPTATGVRIAEDVAVGADINYFVKGFSGYGSQLVMVISSNQISTTQTTYVQFLEDDTLNLEHQYKLVPNYYSNVKIIDAYLFDSGLKLSILGTVKYLDMLPEYEAEPEPLSYIANYQIDHTNGYLKLLNIHYHGLTQFYVRLKDTAFLEGFGYYLTGFTSIFTESDDTNGFLAKYSMLTETTPLEPYESKFLDKMGIYIQENWPSLTTGAGVGVITGGLLIGLIRRKK